MEAINKNKEEVEKIDEGCGEYETGIRGYACGDIDFSNKIILCPACKERKQERIKTSMLWCEFIIEEMSSLSLTYKVNWKIEHKITQDKIKKLQTHLKWLKEQEVVK